MTDNRSVPIRPDGSRAMPPERHGAVAAGVAHRWHRGALGAAALGAAALLSLGGKPAMAELAPPEPFVLCSTGSDNAPPGTPPCADPNTVTQLTLEQAGILKPGGRKWAVILGKALFWDQQAGSDGNACASCHFHAGADTRLRNQINPGLNDITVDGGDTAFGSNRTDTGTVPPGYMPSGAKAGPNYELMPADLPLHKLSEETDRNSPIISTTNDRISSHGAFAGTFTSVKSLGQPDQCGAGDATYKIDGTKLLARQVEPRNTPTTINAAFAHRVFWDGRANNLFNGVGVFGMRDVQGDPAKRLLVFNGATPTTTWLQVEDASLASQALGPPTNIIEMSCDGRRFADVARKLLTTVPLKTQKVSKTDSVLGKYVNSSGMGLANQYLYSALVQNAFDPKWWSTSGLYSIDANGMPKKDTHGYSQIETNFSMFWGIAIMLYEQTLVSDQSEFDTLQNSGALTVNNQFASPTPGCSVADGVADRDLIQRGCSTFFTLAGPPLPPGSPPPGNCFLCHNAQGGFSALGPNQPMLTDGSPQNIGPVDASGHHIRDANGALQPVNNEVFSLFLTAGDVNGTAGLRDGGFASIGLRPPFSDPVSGKTDDYGNPLSLVRQVWNYFTNPDGRSDPATYLLDPPLRRVMLNGLPSPLPTPPNPPGSSQTTDGLGTALVAGAAGPGPGPLSLVTDPSQLTGAAAQFQKIEADGSAKVPDLRNVALTPPYFSWGGYPNLRQVLKLYNRGGNRRYIGDTAIVGVNPITGQQFTAPNPNANWLKDVPVVTGCTAGDTSGTGADGNSAIGPDGKPAPVSGGDCGTNTTGIITTLGLLDCDPKADGTYADGCVGSANPGDTPKTPEDDDLAAVVRFLRSLTDQRVQCDAAPFDHPQLTILAGHSNPGAPPSSVVDKKPKDGNADDVTFSLPEVGASGYSGAQSVYCIPNAGDLFAPGMQARSGGAWQ